MTELVTQAVDEGGLRTTATPAQIRSFLRAQGIRCTPRQARELQERLSGAAPSNGDTFGARLASARLARGLTRVELARIAGCSESYLSYLEGDARSPSDGLLAALANAVRREPEWLRTGEESSATRRIGAVLRDAWEASRRSDWDTVERLTLNLLHEPSDRPLRRHELDEALLLRGRMLCFRGREPEAVRLLEPLVDRVLRHRSDASPVVLGQTYVRALINQADGDMKALARASIIGQQLLTMADDTRDDEWWRLAATLMWVPYTVTAPHLAAAQGEWWLAQLLGDGGVEEHTSGAAALYWNLAIADADLDRPDEALRRMRLALSLQQGNRFPVDRARLQMAYAQMLVTLGAEHAEEALTVLDRCRDAVTRHGYADSLDTWLLIRALAQLAAGDVEAAEQTMRPLVDRPDEVSLTVVHAWLVAGDAAARRGDAPEAEQRYLRAGALLRRAPATPTWAAHWRALADRWTATAGREAEAMEAYRQALDLLRVRMTV
jgi:transcriptional regulator with XRE-family HTH domain